VIEADPFAPKRIPVHSRDAACPRPGWGGCSLAIGVGRTPLYHHYDYASLLETTRAALECNGETQREYAFLAQLAPDFPITPDRLTPEGLLSWKGLDWACDRSNSAVVDNIPHFLPQMLTHPNPQEYCCSYQHGVLQAIAIDTLPDEEDYVFSNA